MRKFYLALCLYLCWTAAFTCIMHIPVMVAFVLANRQTAYVNDRRVRSLKIISPTVPAPKTLYIQWQSLTCRASAYALLFIRGRTFSSTTTGFLLPIEFKWKMHGTAGISAEVCVASATMFSSSPSSMSRAAYCIYAGISGGKDEYERPTKNASVGWNKSTPMINVGIQRLPRSQ